MSSMILVEWPTAMVQKNVNEKKDTPLINHKARTRVCAPNAHVVSAYNSATMQHIILLTL